MRHFLHRVSVDLGNRRNLDAYAITAVASALALLTLVEDAVPEQYRWAVLLSGIAVLVYRITLPEGVQCSGPQVGRRADLETESLSGRLERTRELWIFGPSAVNLLSRPTCGALRRTVLDRPDGVVRVVVLDPSAAAAIEIASHHLDDGREPPMESLSECLAWTLHQLELMSAWQMRGQLDYGLLPFNPGFSMVAFNPHDKDGSLIVEFHAFQETTMNRMNIKINRHTDEQWFDYWVDQFERIWKSAKKV
ncbi:hypothetical protein J5X84_39745 [Streptosporangiaceae bacterium NEAU-GS5]|nr:hypothetical protein [Streptosporangiaceae bacterium NEAU-GS5]